VTDLESDRIRHIVLRLDRLIHVRPECGRLDSETAQALDIVTHALELTGVEQGLSLWREALWGRKLSEKARIAVVRLLEHVMNAAAEGDTAAIDDICGCLRRVVDRDAFVGSLQRIGGVGKHSAEPSEQGR